MTRIIGRLEGPDGPLDGRLYVKAGGVFIGAPSETMVFRIEDGVVNIDLPPCPPNAPYAVDWRAVGDARRLSFVERWRVSGADEMSLDEARGMVRHAARKQGTAEGKGRLMENVTLRGEVEDLQRKLLAAEKENAGLAKRAIQAEGSAVAAQAQAASLTAALTKAQQRIAKQGQPRVVEKERVVERLQSRAEAAEELSMYIQKVALLEEENETLSKRLEETLALSTHFSNLHAQIDRLIQEKQQLLHRIEELKRPTRTVSALRSEAIANLDKLTGS